MVVGEISPHNISGLANLFIALWPECDFEEELEQCQVILKSPQQTCFLLKDHSDYVGFAYINLRNEFVEAATTYPVAYLEGIYVHPTYRNSGWASRLLEISEKWAKGKGCGQLASDTDIANKESLDFHFKNQFKEVSRNVCLIKNLE
ncbi:MAG: aminoglycoside 6'-N-acetyltransferase [Flavobacteriaceae bacterium]|nr:aminoglycoside 6'-N-acetyltransferase [Flavobacteriaceae bacterium]